MKKTFKTEVSQLLDLVINSLYSKKEVFLRELISNASDAIDRARFEALTDKSQEADGEYKINLLANKEAKTLVITDNGIGMDKESLEENLGTIAKSGSEAFKLENETEICGYGMIAKSFSTEFGKPCIWVEDIYIKDGFRGIGIGSNFFELVNKKHPDGLVRRGVFILLITCETCVTRCAESDSSKRSQ